MIEAKTKRVKKCIFTFLHFYTSMKKGMSVFIFTHTFFYVRFEKGFFKGRSPLNAHRTGAHPSGTWPTKMAVRHLSSGSTIMVLIVI